MSKTFFEQPIVNSPYAPPQRHWELDADGQPTNRLIETRRGSSHITPFPRQKKLGASGQAQLDLAGGASADETDYSLSKIINEIRAAVADWRALPNPADWGVTPETARLLQHWRHHEFQNQQPFFCQIEAVETAIWLTEVAPKLGKRAAKFWSHVEAGNAASNPELVRIALKMATGAGKTTVMAMLIAWQTVNAVRRPGSRTWSRGFLIVTPGITIKDRLRVLLPNDAENYYRQRELVPADLLGDIERAKVVVTNFHAFKRRERFEVSRVGRALLEGRGEPLDTLETEGQMLQRVMPDLMGMKGIVAINDEAHHCYRELRRPGVHRRLVHRQRLQRGVLLRPPGLLPRRQRPYKALKTTLKAEIDEAAWSSLNSDTSRPFPKPKSGRIAVKVINHLGDEVMKVFGV